VSHFGVHFLIFFNVFYLSEKNKNPGKHLFSGVFAPVREKIRTPDTLVRSHELFAVFPRLSREGNTSGDTPNKKSAAPLPVSFQQQGRYERRIRGTPRGRTTVEPCRVNHHLNP